MMEKAWRRMPREICPPNDQLEHQTQIDHNHISTPYNHAASFSTFYLTSRAIITNTTEKRKKIIALMSTELDHDGQVHAAKA